MHLFYTPDLNPERPYSLSSEESAHCVKVLRMKERDELLLTDGVGGLYLAEVIQASPKNCLCSVKNKLCSYDNRNFHIHIAMAPTKNNARTEWFVEKAVEMGVDEISLIKTQHSERTVIKTERLEKVAISAMKQSFKSFMPKINPLNDFNALIDTATEAKKFMATCHGEERVKLREAYQRGESVIVLIGPEGDFSEEEVAYARERGFLTLTLGEARLRTETAALYALQGVHFINF